jgi:hypothetical protein
MKQLRLIILSLRSIKIVVLQWMMCYTPKKANEIRRRIFLPPTYALIFILLNNIFI